MQSKFVIFSSLLFSLLLTTIIRAEPDPNAGKEEGKDKEEKPEGGEEGEGEKPEDKEKAGDADKPAAEEKDILVILASIASMQTIDAEKTGEIFLNGYGKAWYLVDKKTGKPVEKITDINAVRIEVPALTILFDTFLKLLPKEQEFLKAANEKIKASFVVLVKTLKITDAKPEGEGEGDEDKEGKGESEGPVGGSGGTHKPATKPAPKPTAKPASKAK